MMITTKNNTIKMEGNKISDELFCKIESSFSGEHIDKVEQLAFSKKTGRELKEYIEHALMVVQNENGLDPAQKKAMELIDYLESLPARSLIKFNKDFSSDDYFTALGHIKKALQPGKKKPFPLKKRIM